MSQGRIPRGRLVGRLEIGLPDGHEPGDAVLAGRVQDGNSVCVITADEGVRGGRTVPLKANTDAALEDCPTVTTVICVKRTGGDVGWVDGRDIWYEDATAAASPANGSSRTARAMSVPTTSVRMRCASNGFCRTSACS